MQQVKRSVALVRCVAPLVVLIMAQPVMAGDAGLRRLGVPVAVDVNDDPDVVEVYLTAKEKKVKIGRGQRTLLRTYNGKFPGPTIEGKVGDTVIVHFANELPEETTIHWHGLEVPANMDGSNISQNAVPPGGTFRYEFKLLRAATYWYHPHIRTNEQVEQGLYGALVVHARGEDDEDDNDADDIYERDRDEDDDADDLDDRDEETADGLPERDHILVLDDILLDDEGNVAEPLPSDPLARATMLLNGREGNTFLVNGLVTPRGVIRRGVPYRLRLINVANSRFMRISIPGQRVFQIAGDGGLLEAPIEIEPIEMVPDPDDPDRMISDPDPDKGLLLTPGERAEIVFTPKGKGPVRLEWHDIARGRHSLSYNDAGGIDIGDDENDGKNPPQTMLTLKQVGRKGDGGYFPPEVLASIEPIDVTGAETIRFEFGHTPAAPNGNVVFFVQRKENVGQCPLPSSVPCPLPFPLVTPEDAPTVRVGDVRIIEVNNLTGGDHNFHMHGFFFQHLETEFIDMDGTTPSVVVPAERLEWQDTIKLPRRPGAFMRSRTVTRLAVRFDDTGREGLVFAAGKVAGEETSGGWVLHCHILEHGDAGMMSFLQVVE